MTQSSTISNFYAPAIRKNEIPNCHHAALNKKKTTEKIDFENARIYSKLRNRSCHVKKVSELV